MERDEVHALTAAYALDALDEVEERDYETHLRGCDRCRLELVDLTEAATSLAFAVEAPAPRASLREQILDQAREERAKVVPLRPRRTATYVSTAVAAVAACVAIGIGIWAASLSNDLDRERDVANLVSDPQSRVVSLTGAPGRLVVGESGEAALVLSGLDEAPKDKTYEVWVIEGNTPRPAGLFRSEGERDVVKLERPVPRGATVAMSVEDEGGRDQPSDTVFASAKA
jgi:hypothetical protein